MLGSVTPYRAGAECRVLFMQGEADAHCAMTVRAERIDTMEEQGISVRFARRVVETAKTV